MDPVPPTATFGPPSPATTPTTARPGAAASTTSSSTTGPLSPATPRTHALLASFADLSPFSTPDGAAASPSAADSPSFLAQPFTPSAVLGNTRSSRGPRAAHARSARSTAPKASPVVSTFSSPGPTTKAAARRRRSSTAFATRSNPKFHSQPRARRASHTPLSARSATASSLASPRTSCFAERSPALEPAASSSSSLTQDELDRCSMDRSTAAAVSASALPPRQSSLRHPPARTPPSSCAALSSAEGGLAASERTGPRKPPPPEIVVRRASPAAGARGGLVRSPSAASALSARSQSDSWALSLGAFETLPLGYQLQPSPPTSPGVSPTAAWFPACGRPRTARLNSASSLSLERPLYSPPRTPLAGARRRSYTSPMRHAQLRASQHPAGLAPGAKAQGREDKARQRAQGTKDKELAKREKERRRRAEEARPLPYAKKVEIDEFLGNLPAKPKKTRAPGSKDVAWRGEQSGRHVGSGRRTEHISEDGSVWLDLEEEQEWAWLLSEVGKGGQPLPHWPQHFTSHLHRPSDTLPPPPSQAARGRAAELEWTVHEIIQDTAYASDDGGPSAWLARDAPEEERGRLVSVFRLRKDGTPRARPASPAGRSDAGSDKDGKRRPKPLQIFGPSAASSSSTVDRPVTPPLDLHALQQRGKSDFLASAFHPASPAHSASPPLPAPPLTPADNAPAGPARDRPRSNSGKSAPAPVVGDKPKATGGALGKVRGFLKKVGKEAIA